MTFDYPVFLWGMLAALGPLLLHFLNWRKPPEIVFPSIRFLERERLPQKGKHHLRDMLVMLLRMLLLALFALILARPRLAEKQFGAIDRKNVFIVDCSASMSGWKQRERAYEWLRQHFRAGDCIIYSADRVIDVKDSVAECPKTLEEGEHSAAVAAALEYLEHGGQLCIISDFKKNDWRNVAKCVPANVKLQLLDCKEPSPSNGGISSVRTSPLAKQKMRVITAVENHSEAEQVRMLTVSIGAVVQKIEVKLPAFGGRRIAMTFDCKRENPLFGTASLDKDEYEADDIYYFALGERKLPKALVIGGEESLYVAHALSGAFEVTMMEPVAVLEEDFSDKQAVFVSGDGIDLSQIPSEVPLIVYGGGGASLRYLRESGRLIAQNAGKVFSTPAHSLGIGKIKDSKLAQLFGDEADLFAYRIPNYQRLNVTGSETEVVLESLDGEPLLLRQGNCCFFAFELGNFVLCNSFLPLLRELVPLPKDFGLVRQEGGKPGVYQKENMLYEVNVPQAESRLESIELDDMVAMLQIPDNTQTNIQNGQSLLPHFSFAALVIALSLLILRQRKAN